jgi:dTDP-4-amino-4,6-dideoxygalactose transaminase
MIPLMKVLVTEDQREAVLRVLNSGRYVLGEENKGLEKEFAEYCGTKYGVALNSGTAALHVALISLGIKNGDEVITVPNTFVATSNAILFVGAKPVFVDIDPKTYTMDVKSLEKSITKKTKAIIPVHLYGHPADMDPIVEVAQKHNLYVVEDACQAHGALYKGKKVGSIGDAGCFSFYPSKNITACGDGGILVTNNEEVAERSKILRDQGQKSKNVHEMLGYNMRLSEMHAAIIRVQLRYLDKWNEARRKNASIYNSLLEKLDEKIVRPIEESWAKHVYHLYVIRTSKRDLLHKYLAGKGVETGIHYPTPIHLQPLYKENFHFTNGTFPITESVAKQLLSLPCHQALARNEVEYIAESLCNFFGGDKH